MDRWLSFLDRNPMVHTVGLVALGLYCGAVLVGGVAGAVIGSVLGLVSAMGVRWVMAAAKTAKAEHERDGDGDGDGNGNGDT